MGKDWNHTTDRFVKSRDPAPHDAALQAGIDAAMRDVIRRDSRSNPNALAPPARGGVAGAVPMKDSEDPNSYWRNSSGQRQAQRGWVEPKPLGPVIEPGSSADRAISAMIDQALPPGGEKKAR